MAPSVDGRRVLEPLSGPVPAVIAKQQLVQGVCGGHGLLEQAPECAGYAEILDDDVGFEIAGTQVDHPRDRRADMALVGGDVLVGHAVDRFSRLVDDEDRVAVGREVLAELRRESHGVGSRPHQDLRRAESSRRENDVPRAQPKRHALALAQVPFGMVHDHHPASAGLLQAQHAGAGVDLRALLPGDAQQVQVERVFRVVIATGGTVTAADVGVELRPGAVRAGQRRDGDLGGPEGARQKRLQGGVLLGLRAGVTRAQRLLERPGQLQQRVVAAQRRRPARLPKHRRVRHRHHAGVDERAAAEPAGNESVDVGADAHVEQPFRSAAHSLARRRGEADVAGDVGHARRKHAAQILAASFENADAGRRLAASAARPVSSLAATEPP